jgi:hypothetical protein
MTYIQGSVDESPPGERSRSLDRPGAKTPRPYPRIAQHQGSFIVSLYFRCTIRGNLLIMECESHQCLTRSPKASKQTLKPQGLVVGKEWLCPLKTYSCIICVVLDYFVFIQPATVSVVKGLGEIPMIESLVLV